MEFTYKHAAIMYARACRAWYGPRAQRVVERTIEELARVAMTKVSKRCPK